MLVDVSDAALECDDDQNGWLLRGLRPVPQRLDSGILGRQFNLSVDLLLEGGECEEVHHGALMAPSNQLPFVLCPGVPTSVAFAEEPQLVSLKKHRFVLHALDSSGNPIVPHIYRRCLSLASLRADAVSLDDVAVVSNSRGKKTKKSVSFKEQQMSTAINLFRMRLLVDSPWLSPGASSSSNGLMVELDDHSGLAVLDSILSLKKGWKTQDAVFHPCVACIYQTHRPVF